MNKKLRQQLAKRKRRLYRRIDKARGFSQSGIRGGKTKIELTEKQQAVSASGIALLLKVIEKLKFRQHIQRRAQVLKLLAPYDEDAVRERRASYVPAARALPITKLRAAIVKNTSIDQKLVEEQKHSVMKQILDSAVVTEGVVDVFALTNLNKPNIGLLSDEFS